MESIRDTRLWTFLLPLPRSRSKRDRLLKTMFSSDIVLEILSMFSIDNILCQRDIVNKLVHHSNKTILKALKELVDTGVLVEEVVESRSPSGRRVKLKCYKLSLLGKWLYMMIVSPENIGLDRLRGEVLELYGLLGESIANSYIELGIEPSMILKNLFKGAINALLRAPPRSNDNVDLLVVGSIAVDYHVELVGNLYSSIVVEPGGSGANIASMSSRLGLKTQLVSSLGVDYEGLISVLSLYNDRVRLSSIVVYEDKSTIKVLVIHRGVEVKLRKLVGRQVAIAPEPSMIDWDSLKSKIYYAGDTYVENALKTGEKALAENKLFVYNPTSEIIAYSPKNVVRIIVEYRPILILNKEALNTLTKTTGLTPKDILSLGARALITTMGSRGARLYVKDKVVRYVPPHVKAIDPTGAGDVLASYAMWRLIKGEDLEEALKWGVTGGAIAVTRIGARYLPDVREVEEKLGETKIMVEKGLER